jgi:hypothetical protein
VDFFRSFVLEFYVRLIKRKTPLKTDQKPSKCTQWNSEFFWWKEIKTQPPACSEKWKNRKKFLYLHQQPASERELQFKTSGCWKFCYKLSFYFAEEERKISSRNGTWWTLGKKLISFKMSLQEKNSILSTFCRNDENFVLQCLRIGSHFLKRQIVKSKYSHNLAENKIAPIASSETNNVICTKRALVIMCSCNRLVCSW